MNLSSKTGTQQQWDLCWSLLARLFLVLTLLCSAIPVSAETRVSDIRIGLHPGKTRAVVELSGTVEISKIFLLDNPYRLVIDLPEIEWDLPSGTSQVGPNLPASVGIVEGFHFGYFVSGLGRIVLDLGGPADVVDRFMLQGDENNPWRLVVDLASIRTEEFPAAKRALAAAASTPQPKKTPLVQVPRGPKAKKVIVIDAGHGGIDPGATGLSGTHEKEVVLDYALELRRQLMAHNMYEVLLTRENDEFVPLHARSEIAVAANAALFLSLHVNTDRSASTAGFSVYTLSEKATDPEAAALAAKENKSDAIAGMLRLVEHDEKPYKPETLDILLDLASREKKVRSVKFARSFLLQQVKSEFSILSRPHRVANFAVLRAPTVPQVLVELGYISNRREERRLLSKSYRRKLSAAIVRSIDLYLTTEDQAIGP